MTNGATIFVMNNNVPPKIVYLAETHTSITTSTNGKEVHVESNDSGSIHVETINGETTIKTSPGMKYNVTEGEAKVEENISTEAAEQKKEEVEKEIKSKTEKIKKEVEEKKAEIKMNIWQQVENIFKRLFLSFKS